MATREDDTEFKDYLFYRGEDIFYHDSDDAMDNYFFCQEKRHYQHTHRESGDNLPTFIDTLEECFHDDYKDIRLQCPDKITWEVICLAIENTYEADYYSFDKIPERAKWYIDHRKNSKRVAP